MGWFGDRMLSQKPRKSGCICAVLSYVVAFGLGYVWMDVVMRLARFV